MIENTNDWGSSGTNIEMDDSTEWVVFEDYKQMESVARENVESSIDEGLMNPEFMNDHQTMSETDMRLWGNDAGDMLVEDRDLDELRQMADQYDVKYEDEDDKEEELKNLFALKYDKEKKENPKLGMKKTEWIDDMIDEPLEKFKEEQEEKLREDVASAYSDYVEKQLKDNGLRDWVVNDQGLSNDEEFDEHYGKWLHTDVEGAVDDAISSDGVGHFLNSYDGDYHELSDGSYLIRTN